jgi:putative ABC transport system permease protein
MLIIALIREATSALWANRLRSGLTMVGMVMGVSSVIAIVALVEGMQSQVEGVFASMGANTFEVTRFGFDLSLQEYLDRLKRKKLTRDLIAPIEEGCPDCAEVGAEAYAYERAKYGALRTGYLEIRGETPNILSMRNFDVIHGRYFTWEDDRRCRQVAFIGYTVYDKFFQNEDPIGKKIRLGSREFTVIGVAEKMNGALINGMDDFVAIPLSTHEIAFPQPGNPVRLIMSAVSRERREQAMDQVRVVLRTVREVPYEKDDDFAILTPDSILGFINDFTRGFRIVMISLPLLSIIVGGIVIMNIMLISVTERTREIGIRKSIGANRRSILTQFLYESVILSLAGGAIGIALGVKAGEMMLSSWLDMNIAPTSLGIILGFSISTAVGLFFGIYPAMKAARLDPVKALSYE